MKRILFSKSTIGIYSSVCADIAAAYFITIPFMNINLNELINRGYTALGLLAVIVLLILIYEKVSRKSSSR